MATTDKKYLDLEGLGTLVNKIKEEDNKRVSKDAKASATTPAFYKVGTNKDGLVTSDTLVKVTKSDITDLGIPSADTNQKVSTDSVTFDNNASVKFVGGTNVSIKGDKTNNTVTIGFTGDASNDNQKVKVGTTTFGENDTVEFKAGSGLAVGADATNKSITYSHATTKPVTPELYFIGKDNLGHVDLGAAYKFGTLTIKTNGTQKGTFKATSPDTAIDITAADLGLSGAMHFKGVLEELPETTDYNAGDVVLVGSKEYVLATNGEAGAKKWNELGDESSHALKTIKISAGGGLTGGGDLSANRTISHATTTAAGAAAVKVGKDTYGHVVLGDALGLEDNGAHTHPVTGTVSIPKITPVATYIKATASGAAIGGKETAKAITSVTPTQSKLVTSSIWGVGGTASVIPAVSVAAGSGPTRTVFGTALTASKATAGTAIKCGAADVGTMVTVVKDLIKADDVAFSASYDTEGLTLNLTPVTVVTGANLAEITPAVATTRTITPYTFSDVSVPVISSNTEVAVASAGTAVTVATRAAAATTVATGALATTGGGADIVTGLTTGTTDVLTDVEVATQPTIILEKVGVEEDDAVSVVDSITVGTETANVSGTAASSGSHTHTFK